MGVESVWAGSLSPGLQRLHRGQIRVRPERLVMLGQPGLREAPPGPIAQVGRALKTLRKGLS